MPETNDADVVKPQTSDPETKQPPLYKVMLMNDDYTPFNFVVETLQTFFSLDNDSAYQIMLAAHQNGSAPCGVFTKDVAETKAYNATDYARQSEHPLTFDVQASEGSE